MNKEKQGHFATFVADWIQERVKDYFNTTGRVFPNTDKALHFISEENGEAASAWNTIDGDDWLRNNPDGHQETMSDFVDELGDIALMAIVTAMSVDANAIGAMIAKIERKESEVEIAGVWIDEKVGGDPVESVRWENPNPWFPVDDLSDPALVMDVGDDLANDVQPCGACVWFFKCATVRDRDPDESCVTFTLRKGAQDATKDALETTKSAACDCQLCQPRHDVLVTIGCQRRKRINGLGEFLYWECQTPRTLCGYHDTELYPGRAASNPVCGHLDPTSTSPMVDDPDDVYNKLDRTEG